MGNTVLLTVRGPSGREWSRSFHVREPDEEIYRLVYKTTAKVARDRLACCGLGGASVWSTVERALHERDESGTATTVRLDAGETLADHTIEWATTLTDDEAKDGERCWQLLIEAMDGLFKTEELWPMLHGLAVLTAAAPPETVIRIDMSDTDWAWEDHEGALLVDYLPIELSSLQPAALLCEGVFDARVLTHAIAATHPHLTSHLLIPDFGFDREGGSAALTRLVRGLASVGVRDSRIIAVFDADRAGTLEAERLKGVELPPNFTVTTLPHLRALERYPVIGPERTSDTDVNGWGAALETYLAVEMGMGGLAATRAYCPSPTRHESRRRSSHSVWRRENGQCYSASCNTSSTSRCRADRELGWSLMHHRRQGDVRSQAGRLRGASAVSTSSDAVAEWPWLTPSRSLRSEITIVIASAYRAATSAPRFGYRTALVRYRNQRGSSRLALCSIQ